MPTLNIEGKRVKVDDSFLSLSPEEQNATVEEIARSLGNAPEVQLESDASREFRDFASMATQNPARGQYDTMPAWQKPLQAADDTIRLMANGMTFGYADKIAALLEGNNVQDQRSETQGARNRAGGAGLAAELTGAVATPMGLARNGVTLAGRMGTAGMTGAKGLAARTGLMAAEGAGYGALTAAGNDQDIGTGAALGAAGGALGNVAAEGISAGISKVASKFNPKVPRATVSDIEKSARDAYRQAEQAGVVFNAKGVNQLQRNVVDDLTSRAFDPANEPGVVPVLKRLQALSGQNLTFEGLDTLRKVASNGFIPGNRSNNAALSQIIDRIDELVNTASRDRSVVLMGNNPKDAQNAILKARSLWSRARKLETVEKAITRGEQNAASQVSGDVGRTTMGQLKRTLQSEAKTRGFTPAEMKALGSAAGYSPGQRVAHAVGGLMPRGRLLASIHGATALGTGGTSLPLQAAGAAVGYTAQKTADALAKRSVNELVDLIANGGIPPQQVQNVVQLLAKSKREALARALMAAGVKFGSMSFAQ
ncbi:hypothetical protein [Mesorhizobium sp. Z1-4]|uniref:hypothetical protein n=1 Tax=Mesorhizobium sp. Z1-4 TaxID=2448478 RepID=UPI000FDB359D|nr:hypothetical protein [Mesorhizobium sp. Z1-4]